MSTHLPAAARLSRRRFVQTAALAAAGMSGSLARPARSAAGEPDVDRDAAPAVPPKPIPGGITLPGGEVIHVWAPGDPKVTLPISGLTLMGFDVEPSTMTDFRGFARGLPRGDRDRQRRQDVRPRDRHARLPGNVRRRRRRPAFRFVRLYMSGSVRARFGFSGARL